MSLSFRVKREFTDVANLDGRILFATTLYQTLFLLKGEDALKVFREKERKKMTSIKKYRAEDWGPLSSVYSLS